MKPTRERVPDEKAHLFSSTAGVGSVKVQSLSGLKLTFFASGVVAEPVLGLEYDGTGSLGVEIVGLAKCYDNGL